MDLRSDIKVVILFYATDLLGFPITEGGYERTARAKPLWLLSADRAASLTYQNLIRAGLGRCALTLAELEFAVPVTPSLLLHTKSKILCAEARRGRTLESLKRVPERRSGTQKFGAHKIEDFVCA